jgi:two-component system phosphate regulon response regulator OmpR
MGYSSSLTAQDEMGAEKASILVVDDDENQRWMLKKYLQKHGFEVSAAEDGEVMRALLAEQKFELILLDVSMPGEDGFSAARYLREHHKVGIIMLTAAAELFDRVLGLEIGADDYVTKPFEPRELLARIKSVLRRIDDSTPTYTSDVGPVGTVGHDGVVTSSDPDQKGVAAEASSTSDGAMQSLPILTAQFGQYTLNLSAKRLTNPSGEHVSITAMEYDLLKAFAENPGIVLSRETLLSIAHKQEAEPFDRSIDIRIGRVRRKIESDPSKPSIIKTVRGLGYVYAQD